MKKGFYGYFFIIFLVESSFSTNFLYDNEKDIVYFNNQKYVNFDHLQLKSLQLNSVSEENLTISDGDSFWFYVGSIVCKP